MTYPERIIPDETEPGIVALHLKRYEFARPWCEGKDVLDAACGTGYGSASLAEVARRVVGIDLSADAVAYARRRYARGNIEFVVGDVLRLPFADQGFDSVCSFETIEHVPDPAAFAAEIARVLRPGGTLVISTPHVRETNRSPDNPFHLVELARGDFTSLLERNFSEVQLYGQQRRETSRHRAIRRLDVFGLRKRVPLLRRATALTGTPATEQVTADDVLIQRDAIERATELVAVCRGPRR